MSYNALSQTITTSAQSLSCGECGIEFAVPDRWYREKVDDHTTWYCPNGHRRHFTGKSDAEKLRDELAREKHRREQADARAEDLRHQRDHIERQRRGTLGALRKVQKRVKHGVCPCCHRTFQNVKNHMASQHPTFAPEA